MILDYFRRATLYQVVDPAAARRWFAIWVLANDEEPSRLAIIRDWPDEQTYGEWATATERTTTADSRKGWGGDIGPAQGSEGWGPERYREEFRRIEEKELFPWLREQIGAGAPQEVYQRLVDPRAGAAPTTEGTTLIDRLAADAPGNPGMWFDAAPGLPEEEGMAAIEALLEWRPTLPASWPDNLPRLFVHERCRQVIWCLSNFNRMSIGDSKAPMRDPVDLCRYMALAELGYVGGGALEGRRGRGVY